MGIARVDNPDEITCTLEFTLALSEWKHVKKTLSSNSCWAEIQIMDEIRGLVSQIEQTYYSCNNTKGEI